MYIENLDETKLYVDNSGHDEGNLLADMYRFSIYFASVWLVDTAPFSNFVALTTNGPQN